MGDYLDFKLLNLVFSFQGCGCLLVVSGPPKISLYAHIGFKNVIFSLEPNNLFKFVI